MEVVPMNKKCSRCRVKRNESPEELQKYATCSNCRNKRRIERPTVSTISSEGAYDDYGAFLQKIKLNTEFDVYDHRLVSVAPPDFPRFSVPEVDDHVFAHVAKQLISFFIQPMMDVSGFRFPVRDYHKGGTKSKKISFSFICSQDRTKQRKSRSNDKRSVTNKLKVHDCDSKISLNYDLVTGKIQILYNHKHHKPYLWKRQLNEEDEIDATSIARQAHFNATRSIPESNLRAESGSQNNLFYQATAAELSTLNTYMKGDIALPLISNEISVENIDQELIRESLN